MLVNLLSILSLFLLSASISGMTEDKERQLYREMKIHQTEMGPRADFIKSEYNTLSDSDLMNKLQLLKKNKEPKERKLLLNRLHIAYDVIQHGNNLLKKINDLNAGDPPSNWDRYCDVTEFSNQLAEYTSLVDNLVNRPPVQSCLWSDSISARKWMCLEFDVTRSSFDFDEKVRKKETFIPEDLLNPDDTILMVVTHGTFGKLTRSFVHDLDANYRSIKRFATWYATKEKSKVDLVSMKWSGSLFDTPRFNAAQELNDYIEKNYPNSRKVFIAHSHGCNLHNKYSHMTKKPIELMINVSCPKRRRHEEPHYQPTNYKKLIYFRAPSDWTESLGRCPKNGPLGIIATVGTGLATLKLGHSLATGAISVLNVPALLALAGVYGAAHISSVAGPILLRNMVRRLKEDYKFIPEADEAIVIGLRIVVNDESLGHSGAMDAMRYLPELMEKFEQELPGESAHGFRADLYIQDPKYTGYDEKIHSPTLKISLENLIINKSAAEEFEEEKYREEAEIRKMQALVEHMRESDEKVYNKNITFHAPEESSLEKKRKEEEKSKKTTSFFNYLRSPATLLSSNSTSPTSFSNSNSNNQFNTLNNNSYSYSRYNSFAYKFNSFAYDKHY